MHFKLDTLIITVSRYFEMVITYGAHLRPRYIGDQSAQIDPDLRFI